MERVAVFSVSFLMSFFPSLPLFPSLLVFLAECWGFNKTCFFFLSPGSFSCGLCLVISLERGRDWGEQQRGGDSLKPACLDSVGMAQRRDRQDRMHGASITQGT